MKKELKLAFKILIMLLIVSLYLSPFFSKVFASDTKDIDIATSPEKILFDISNLKPGDWSERSLTIQNKGKQDFKYLASSKLKNGSDKLYNELLLEISNNKYVLFKGKFEDFKKLSPRFIAKNNSEQLLFKVLVPEKLGNDFQGLGCEVEFKFFVEGTLGGMLPVDGPKLPETGTSMFNIMVAGAVLIFAGSIWQFVLAWRRKIAKHV